jgi:predicted PurR-regulated permease PerM
MHCRAVMLPSMLILLAVAGLASLAGMWGCLRNRKG